MADTSQRKLGDVRIIGHKFIGRFDGVDAEAKPLSRGIIEVTFSYASPLTDQQFLERIREALFPREGQKSDG